MLICLLVPAVLAKQPLLEYWRDALIAKKVLALTPVAYVLAVLKLLKAGLLI